MGQETCGGGRKEILRLHRIAHPAQVGNETLNLASVRIPLFFRSVESKSSCTEYDLHKAWQSMLRHVRQTGEPAQSGWQSPTWPNNSLPVPYKLKRFACHARSRVPDTKFRAAETAKDRIVVSRTIWPFLPAGRSRASTDISLEIPGRVRHLGIEIERARQCGTRTLRAAPRRAAPLVNPPSDRAICIITFINCHQRFNRYDT